jgi:hypothetical protein
MVRGLLKSRWHEMVYVMAGQMIDDDSYNCVPKGHYNIVFYMARPCRMAMPMLLATVRYSI